MDYPLELTAANIEKYEHLLDASINVYGYEDFIYPIHESANCQTAQEIEALEYIPIDNNGVLKVQGTCKRCGKSVQKVVDYSKFKQLCKEFETKDLHLLLRKGVYPYEWVDSFSKFSQQLPQNKGDWYSTLNDKNVSESDLKHSVKVYRHFDFKNFGEYHDLYLKLDTILLKDTFDNFRETCYRNYGLDPVYYVSAPSLTMAAALKDTKQEVELLTDAGLYEIYENGIRGGMSMIPLRHAEANNCYFYDGENPVKLSEEKAKERGIWNSKKHVSFIMYYDCNNLYGDAMSKPLPIGKFISYEKNPELLDRKPSDFTEKVILNLKDDNEIGYTFIVDLEIPTELHDKFADFPMLPEKYVPELDELSEYQRHLIEIGIGKAPNPEVCKLISTLKEKRNYVVDYRMLKECLKQGIVLKEVKNYIQYEQEAWLKPYIEKNTHLRQLANNDFEKDFYKGMNNALYGKQMQRMRDRCQVKLIRSKDIAEKYSDYESREIISDNMVLLYRKEPKIKLNQPIFGGFAVLELSKILMFQFWYNFLQKKYGDKIKLLGTDTDSLIVYIETEDVYEDMKESIEYFDTWDYKLKGMPWENKKVPGKFKDEYLGIPIREFVGLRSKMYAFRNDVKEKKLYLFYIPQ
nr:PREDICTED: uncharacterized protein LOC109036984 [Bemisia tabaci]